MALYLEDEDFAFDRKLSGTAKVFSNKKIRTSKRHVHTCADPFLFTSGGYLYIFFESQAVAESGKIELILTKDLKEFSHLGEVLVQNHHLSYPFVFERNRQIYMIPESIAANEVHLYKFDKFPLEISRFKTLLIGDYVDSSVIHHKAYWYLFTTSERGLEIFYTEDIESKDLIPHPNNPITGDPRYSRCGGGPLILNGEIYRIAQDCSGAYGRNVSVLRILTLSPLEYREEILVQDYFECDQKWNSQGGHHMSIADFKGHLVIAVDGNQKDYLVNKLLSPFFKFV